MIRPEVRRPGRVIRHGETAWYAQGRIQGHLDSPLNDEGLAQALMVGERMVHERFDALYSSDLGRALQTVQPIADRTGHPVVAQSAAARAPSGRVPRAH